MTDGSWGTWRRLGGWRDLPAVQEQQKWGVRRVEGAVDYRLPFRKRGQLESTAPALREEMKFLYPCWLTCYEQREQMAPSLQQEWRSQEPWEDAHGSKRFKMEPHSTRNLTPWGHYHLPIFCLACTVLVCCFNESVANIYKSTFLK